MRLLTGETLALGARGADERAGRNAAKGPLFSVLIDLFHIYLPLVALTPVFLYF